MLCQTFDCECLRSKHSGPLGHWKGSTKRYVVRLTDEKRKTDGHSSPKWGERRLSIQVFASSVRDGRQLVNARRDLNSAYPKIVV